MCSSDLNAISNVMVTLALGNHPAGASLSLSAELIDGEADFSDIAVLELGTYSLIANSGKTRVTSKKFSVSGLP